MTLEIAIRHDVGDLHLEAELGIGAGLTALFGPSGSGKTTLINIVAGLVRPQSGRIAFDGEVWVDTATRLFTPPHRRGIGYVFQEGRLFPHMTVRRNLDYGTRFHSRALSAADAGRIVDMLSIGPLMERRPANLSGGEKQRVALGRALMSSPRLLLMDEPLSALDAGLKAAILPYIERVRDEAGIPIVYVSHSLEEVTRLATRVVAVDNGRISLVPGVDRLGLSNDGAMPGGSFLQARVAEQLPEEGLTIATGAIGQLFLRHADLPIGTAIRVFVPASEIVLAAGEIGSVSTLNQFHGVVKSLAHDRMRVSVTVDCGGELLTANVTPRSAHTLALEPGSRVTVLFKALSLGPEGLFRHG